MKTLEKKAKEAFVILGDKYFNLLKETNPRGDFKHFIKMAVEYGFRHGYSAAQEWISVDDELPLAYKSGEWDGLKSDEVMVKTKQGKHYIAVLYSGIMDGSQFNEFYESNCDFELNEITHWQPINND